MSELTLDQIKHERPELCACNECLTADQAALFLQGFNEAMLADLRQLWAVAVPVEVLLAGDLASGEPVHDVQRLTGAEPYASRE